MQNAQEEKRVIAAYMVRNRELHGNGDSGNTAVIRGDTAVMGTTRHILPR